MTFEFDYLNICFNSDRRWLQHRKWWKTIIIISGLLPWHGKNHNTMKTYYIKSKRQTNLIWTTCRKNCFRYLKPMSPLNAAICTTISYTLWVEWYYLKNNYLTLRSKVKVPQKSLRYATHHLMVMHPHTKYHWPISKDKKILFKLEAQVSLYRSPDINKSS